MFTLPMYTSHLSGTTVKYFFVILLNPSDGLVVSCWTWSPLAYVHVVCDGLLFVWEIN